MRAILKRMKTIERGYDIPYIAGYSRDGKTVFIDRHKSWSRFLRRVAKVDSMTRRTIHHEDAQTVHGRVQGEGRA